MIPIKKPSFSVREVFLSCISTVNNNALKQELTNCLDTLESAESDFDAKFKAFKIHEIEQNKIVFGNIEEPQMKSVYNYRMVQSIPGRNYYDKLKSAAAYGKCPLCSVRDVDTLDHYLPKTKYPVFAVTPLVLIPSCTPCNKGKSVDFPKCSEEQTLHPYYDNINDLQWLRAVVIHTSPVTFSFSVNPNIGWTNLQFERVKGHFEAFHLNELFSSHANEEFRGAEKQLRNLFNKHPDVMKDHLREAYESKLELGINSWQAATYSALLNDLWFCGGGSFA